jgi:hypothetical protein
MVATDETNFTTGEVGRFTISEFGSMSFLADNDTSASGVTGQGQQANICSSGVKAWTFTQIFDALPPAV